MIAQSDPQKWGNGENGVIPWLIFDQVDGLAIVGRGLLDGQGKSWWDIHCRDHPGPVSFLFFNFLFFLGYNVS